MQALLCVLIAFHDLYVHQFRHLKLTDFDDDGRRTTRGRVIAGSGTFNATA
ncbi:hypothetical protein [Streptomyces sp. NPDC059378]|uniref:hypothetical protein n=1 Tax=Streptomyces sp. NPDC059378 TaxID=3346815 RepID=UPI0036A12B61